MPALNVNSENAVISDMTHVNVIYVYPISMMLQTASVWVFVLITAERFLAVCYPLQV